MRPTTLVSARGAAVALAITVILGTAPAVQAGGLPYWGLRFGTPEKAAAQFGVVFGDHVPSRDSSLEGLTIGAGTLFEASLGSGGAKVGLGRSVLVLTEVRAVRALADYRITAARTWAFPRGASAHATYAGLEGGLSLSFLRISLGVSKRLESKGSGSDWLWNWGLGLQLGGFGKGRATPDARGTALRSISLTH